LRSYLPKIGCAQAVEVATQVVHFTGYELSLDSIELDNPKDSMMGHLLGTADLIAQIADRCYLEKCRDRLFPEFVLAGIAIETGPTGTLVRYRSGKDLLEKTPRFYQEAVQYRLEKSFNRAYRYLEAYFEDANPYMVFINKNLNYLTQILESGDWDDLRRHPPCFISDPRGEAQLTKLALGRIKMLAATNKLTLNGARDLQLAFA
jgi:hypothetical protein